MVRRIGGARRKSRNKFTKHYRRKGKTSLSTFFQTLNIGDRVTLVADVSHQESLYHERFHGHSGAVEGMQGECYKVRIKDGDKAKMLIVHPVHLRKM